MLHRPPARALASAVFALLLATGLAGCGRSTSAGEDPAAGSASGAEDTAITRPIAVTAHGPVRGMVDSGILTFKGIRYGADTATTRFAAPARPGPWNEPADAVDFGASCPQVRTGNPGGLFTSWRPEPLPPLGEDCLFLNVWTPATGNEARRPVMVWFHGGGFTSGDGSSRAYDGARLAQRGDVVVVTVNHRLNVFGYLALGHYGAGFEDSAVAGVLDMILALEWVRDNIANFGGDPNSVMIFGESGGGAKVSTLLSTERARGLFHRAVIQSGAMLRFPEQATAQAAADQVLEKLGLDRSTAEQIRTMPVEAIQAAHAGTGAATAPSIDGRLLTRHPFEPYAAPPCAAVPLMLGTNRTENSLFVGAVNPAIFDLTWESLEGALRAAYPERDVAAIIAGYRELQPESGPTDVFFEATSDARWLAGHVTLAERRVAQGGAPTWLYLFDWNTPVDGGKWRSPHALEIGFVFDNVAYSESMSGTGEEQQRVADIMADTWIAFAKTGDPNNAQIPAWPAYDLEQRPVMVLDATPERVDDARGAQRALMGADAAYGSRYQP
jgi:para-nitrobenzyl esterase